MSMLGLRRSGYTLLTIAAALSIGYLAYQNYERARLKSNNPDSRGLQRRNAIRRPPRRRLSPLLDDGTTERALGRLRAIAQNNEALGQYRNAFLHERVQDFDQLNRDLTPSNLEGLYNALAERAGLGLAPLRLLRQHIQMQFIQEFVRESYPEGYQIRRRDTVALSSALVDLGLNHRVARYVLDAINRDYYPGAEEWDPSREYLELSSQVDGATGEDLVSYASEHDDDDDSVDAAGIDLENAGGSQSMLNILYQIGAEQGKRDGYIHRGVECNSCGAHPIQGIRYHCVNCFDYDLCETCEANQVHIKSHVFYKIRIPAPSRGQIKQVMPKWYPGNPNAFLQNMPEALLGRLKDETGMDQTEIGALYEQFKCLAGSEYPDDPCEIEMAMDRKAFDMYFTPEKSGNFSPSNLIFDRIFSFYDRNDDGLIGFEEFVKGLADLQNKSRMAKLMRIFQGYDLDADGYVCRKDFLRILRAYYDLSKQLNREFIANQEDMGYLDDEIREVVQGSQPISAAFGGSGFSGHQSRIGADKQEGANGDLVFMNGPNDVLQRDHDFHGDRARAIGNAAVGNRPRPHPFRSFRDQPRRDESLISLPITNGFEMVGIVHPDDATEEELTGPDPPLQTYGWPPLLPPETSDVISALGRDIPIEDIDDPLDRSRVIYAQSQRLDAESDCFLDWTRRKAVHDRWKRRQFYLDEEEGMVQPQGYTEPDSSDEESEEPEVQTTHSPRRQSLRSRSSSKVRFDDSAIDTDYETRSNASSRSIPQNERWGGYELSHPEIEVGRDILYEAVQQGFNELLDKLFKAKEDQAMEAMDSHHARQEWKEMLEQHKKKIIDAKGCQIQAFEEADMKRTKELLGEPHSPAAQSPAGSPKTAFDGPGAEPDNVVELDESGLPADRAKFVAQMYGNQIMASVKQAINEVKLAGALSEANKTAETNEDKRDPTMPQFRPNEEDIEGSKAPQKRTPQPDKATLEKWLYHDVMEKEIAERGGAGKLNFQEFRLKMRREDEAGKVLCDDEESRTYWEKSADLGKLSFVGTWLEMASF